MKQEGPTRDLSRGIPWLRHKSLVARVNPPGSTSWKLRLDFGVVNGEMIGADGTKYRRRPPALLWIRFSNLLQLSSGCRLRLLGTRESEDYIHVSYEALRDVLMGWS